MCGRHKTIISETGKRGKERVTRAGNRRAAKLNLKVKESKFRVGDKMLVLNANRANLEKLMLVYSGPYEISKAMGRKDMR